MGSTLICLDLRAKEILGGVRSRLSGPSGVTSLRVADGLASCSCPSLEANGSGVGILLFGWWGLIAPRRGVVSPRPHAVARSDREWSHHYISLIIFLQPPAVLSHPLLSPSLFFHPCQAVIPNIFPGWTPMQS